MDFRIYDIMSSLVHGVFILGIILYLFDIEYNVFWSVLLIGIAYIIGYLVNAIGSWLEPVYYWFMGGKPSTLLFHNKNGKLYSGYGKIKFFHANEVINMLKQDINSESVDEDRMFGRALFIANSADNSRIADFNASYVFARSLLTTIIITSALLIATYYDTWKSYLIVLLIIPMGIRCKERGYYYAKEVLNTYYYKTKNND